MTFLALYIPASVLVACVACGLMHLHETYGARFSRQQFLLRLISLQIQLVRRFRNLRRLQKESTQHVRQALWRRKLARVTVDPDRKCPACGHAKGTIRFDPPRRQIIHRCQLCWAQWGEPPIVRADDWCPQRTPEESVSL